MKLRLYLLAGTVSLATAVHAQEPVAWTYSAKSIGPNVYELHITAKIDAGWHIYSEHQPKTHIAIPTSISFAANPLLAFQQMKEEGKVVHYKDDNAGIEQDQYSNKVDFVEVVKVKAAVKTRISGSLTWQACTDEQCLPPENKSFSIDLLPPQGAKLF